LKNIIIGTAGHIDHGKTTLIKALTGTDTDRLKEEKKRGISIDLGFTHFDLPSGKRAGIIDVPGHEKFIRNMLAGVGGMDIVMLVIAADEGIMPQTKEHLDILTLLNIKKGVIVLTKVGLVDNDWLQLIKEDIRNKVIGTFLEAAEIVEVDSHTGLGIPSLIQTIDSMTEETESRDVQSPARMPIDRVFTIVGFGTVVTGTLIEGKINLEDTLEILPQKIKVRVRSLQVHGKSVDAAYAGQRVAVNLANIKKEDIDRGHILAQVDSLEVTMMLDGRLKALKDAPRTLKNRDRVRLYHGSSELLARVVLLDRDQLEAGESCYVQLRLEEETAVKRDDKMVLRFYSPMETIGSITVIDPKPKKHKQKDSNIIQELKSRELGSPEDILEKQIERYSKEFPDAAFLAKATGNQQGYIESMAMALSQKGKIHILEQQAYIHDRFYRSIIEGTEKQLGEYHKRNPLRGGMLKEELKSKLFSKNKNKGIDVIFTMLERDNIIKLRGKDVALYDFKIQLSGVQEKIKTSIEEMILRNPFAPPSIEEIIKGLPYKPQEVQQVLEAMVGNELIKITNEMYLHKSAYSDAVERLKAHINKNKSITLAEFRDLLDTSRKYAMAILEFFDNNKVTKRVEDKRVLY